MKFRQNHKGEKSDYKTIANVRHLTRLLTYLREVRESYRKEMTRATGINHACLNSALVFLENNNMIIKLRKGKLIYVLNPLFL